jgi:hypothetical protein
MLLNGSDTIAGREPDISVNLPERVKDFVDGPFQGDFEKLHIDTRIRARLGKSSRITGSTLTWEAGQYLSNGSYYLQENRYDDYSTLHLLHSSLFRLSCPRTKRFKKEQN